MGNMGNTGCDRTGQYYNGFGQDYDGLSHMGCFLIMMALGIIVALTLAYALYRILKKGTTKHSKQPQQLLEKRYVNGEISREEYQEKKATLRQK